MLQIVEKVDNVDMVDRKDNVDILDKVEYLKRMVDLENSTANKAKHPKYVFAAGIYQVSIELPRNTDPH